MTDEEGRLAGMYERDAHDKESSQNIFTADLTTEFPMMYSVKEI